MRTYLFVGLGDAFSCCSAVSCCGKTPAPLSLFSFSLGWQRKDLRIAAAGLPLSARLLC